MTEGIIGDGIFYEPDGGIGIFEIRNKKVAQSLILSYKRIIAFFQVKIIFCIAYFAINAAGNFFRHVHECSFMEFIVAK